MTISLRLPTTSWWTFAVARLDRYTGGKKKIVQGTMREEAAYALF